MNSYWELNGGHGLILRTGLRTGQFLFAIAAAGLNGADIATFSRAGQPVESFWIFAEVLVVFSAFTCGIHCLFTLLSVLWCLWDAALFIMWLAVAVQAGDMVIGSDDANQLAPGVSVGDTHVRATFAINLINMVLWLATLMEAVLFCCSARTVKRRVYNNNT